MKKETSLLYRIILPSPPRISVNLLLSISNVQCHLLYILHAHTNAHTVQIPTGYSLTLRPMGREAQAAQKISMQTALGERGSAGAQ